VFDLEIIRDLTDHPYRLQCEQFHFTNLALERLIKNPLFEIRFGHELLDVESTDGEVRVHVREPGGDYEINTPWLIAADGGRSAVRKSLNLAFEGGLFPKTSITLVMDHPFQDDIPGLLGVNYVWTDTGHYSRQMFRRYFRRNNPIRCCSGTTTHSSSDVSIHSGSAGFFLQGIPHI
jgi:3-(3-hydroxy-phenyl)propionate hydroxylase